jgi:hypothetical protein
LARVGIARHKDRARKTGVQAMRDDYLDRSWADHHFEFTDAFHKLLVGFKVSMETLTAHQFDAPWRRPARRESCTTR